ncbi:MAG: hypothetical protein PHI91_03510 [Candidatus Pacebacteria bacterium]|nr:hypothetical protein [Candidatus Paceibacterota bacterium]MDD2757631.1 hypothetical protein [Candidatus Paceibacterota bacterium]MDD3283580.1 hypothetical protein [Candidatus Paceibacterota bacterium]MDD3970225.1 hypothetical protein [Candidatus Paceibacterota bacterium]MDD4738252.1 hypothetical protein [Candidatus Paceibacterota bacterium]
MIKLKRILFLFIFIAIVFCFFFPIEMTGAIEESDDIMFDPVNTIATAIITTIVDIAINTCSVVLKISSQILSWAIDGGGVDQAGSQSPVVTEGWGIVRNLANAALIIGLVIIAINIILGKEEGQAKKTLVNFVIVALLINFTPLICGFFIDGSNIIANSFIGQGLDPLMNNQLNDAAQVIREMNILEALLGIGFLVVFTIISLFVYLLYAILFLARTVILWILIIASPIALATKVFPKSNAVRKFFPSILYWDDWYEMFLQWVIIVIPAALFIHLSNIAIRAAVVTDSPGDFDNILDYLLVLGFSYFIPLILLIAGFMITISSGGSVAAPLGALGKKAWAATAGAAGGYALGKAKSGAKATGSWVKEGAVGSAAAIIKRENPLNKAARDSGMASVDKVKSSIGGAMTGAKDYLRIGESNTWAKRSAETEKQLAEGMDNYFDGSKEENVVKFNLAQQQLEKLRLSKSLSQKELSKRYENLFIAATNNGDIEDSAIENFLSQSKGKGVDVDYGKMLRGTSAVDIMKKYKPKALERGFIAEKLVDTKQGEYILTNPRATQAHSKALFDGIKNSKNTGTQAAGAASIGASSSPGDATQKIDQAEQILAGELDSLNSKATSSGLSDEEEKRRDEVSDQLKSLKGTQ